MFKLLSFFFAVLMVALAAPRPDPLTIYQSGGVPISLTPGHITYSNPGYDYAPYAPYASGYYNYHPSPLAYKNLAYY